MKRAAAAVETAAKAFAAAEQEIAAKMGVQWVPSCIVLAISGAAERLRMRAASAGYFTSLHEGTCGLVE